MTAADIRRCQSVYGQQLQENVYRPRFQLATPGEEDFLVAMAQADPANAGVRRDDAAGRLARRPTKPSRIIDGLRTKGLVFQARPYGPYEFTVPGFGAFLRDLPSDS